jgi:short-subunit dehydrogenase
MQADKKRIVIVGASSVIAEHCARIWAQKINPNFVLVGRNQEKLDSIAQDLQVRSPNSKIEIFTFSFSQPQEISENIAKIFQVGPVDIALIAHGTLPSQNECQENLPLNQHTLMINGISPALFAEAFAQQMEKNNHGSLAVISSVAGDRGRKSNYVYGSAKGLVSRYIQGLQHRLANTNVYVTLIKPGPTDTTMTAHLKSTGARLASPQLVAKCIIDGIENKVPTVYAPKKWSVIMLIIQHIPRFIFNKLNI